MEIRLEEREFSNGDVYSGQLRGTLPHGKGKYAWSDGIIYEGDWEEGKISGKGKITWLSGAKYEGDFSGGYLHGFGTMTSPDGSVYSGSWRMNVRHGLGRKEYCNSDSYDGSWREGLQDGSGSYTWTNGNRFIGNWKKGKMSGRGVMSWGNGDLLLKLKWGKKVRFVVMGNMFCTELKIHRRYDLKGSTQGRFTEKNKIREKTTMKDLDLAYEFHMDKLLREALFKQILLDCSFLESLQIIDYSLLLGLHFRAPDQLNDILEPPNEMSDQESDSVASVEVGLPREPSIPPKGLLLVTHEPNSVNTAPGPHIRGSTLRAFAAGEKEVDLILPGTARLRVQLGVNMPAQAHHKLHQDQEESGTVELFEVYDVVVYMGMIDILQEYNMKKRMEHTCKSIQYDPMSISAIEPTLYAKRFTDFLLKVFPETA
ncbi:hypothetical protein F2Q70_00001720 [Brassica cretica]|uniref:1-phosphatidylinositol-4-phosphate 5-kinase n=1 Tax=Brassica cretica TaxID=69181 RepID=A0A8S9IYB0_BRACR|nr:hypothetical protein F2Q70_00001720 [Brassica cretica]